VKRGNLSSRRISKPLMLATKEGLLRFTLLRPQAGVGAIATLGLANPFFFSLIL